MAMPSKSKIFEHWMDWLDKNGLDWGEPSCWACGKHWGADYDITDPHASREEIIKNWNRVPLQRCHIIAKQFGGSDDTSNLFLMCIDCHDKAPNTPSREAFLLWAKKQNWYVNFKEMVMKEIDTYGLHERMQEITELLQNDRSRKEISNKLGLHMSQKGHGTQITVSTYTAAIYDILMTKDKSLNELQEDTNFA